MTEHSTEQILVTGGAGFIGSHLSRRLRDEGHTVTVVDDLSNGHAEWVPDDVEFINADLTQSASVTDLVTPNYDLVVHLASRKAVDDDDPRGQFRDNTEMTYDIVEAALDAGVSEFVFTSSSTVYGEAPRPTPEDYAPLEPISAYGASKLACEGILSTAAHSHGLSVYNFRFANIVGPRLRGAVVPDFIEKLRESPDSLRILGDGRQEKSYMHVEDCLDAMLYVYEHADGPIATFNLGTRTTTSVNRIADIVADEMELTPDYQYTGGDRGWTGDVPKMRLSVEKLSGVGWEPSTESDRAVRRATRELLDEL
jgi:UDP-glucose 4-epimerase